MTEDSATYFPSSIPLPSPHASLANDTITFALERDQFLAKVELGVLSLILALDFCGNGLVIIALYLLKRRKKLTRMNRMIAHLTIADLTVGFLNVLPQLAWKTTFHFQGGQYLCKFVPFVQLAAMYGSSYVLLMTALDRYLAICHPLKMHLWGPRRMNVAVCLAWVVSGVFSLPQVFIFSLSKHPVVDGISDCIARFEPEWTLRLYITWVTSAIYIIPTLLLVLTYSKICFVVWSSASWRRSQQKTTTAHHTQSTPASATHSTQPPPPTNAPEGSQVTTSTAKTDPAAMRAQVSHAKVKTVKLTMAVIASYVVCYGPYFVSQMWAAWDETAPFEESAMVITLMLASLNSCTNPWIYLAFNGQFARYLPFRRTRRPSSTTGGATPTQKRNHYLVNSQSNFTSRQTSSTTTTHDSTTFESLRLFRR